jgi:amino acid transporter
VTGFFFPVKGLLPSHVVGIISLVVLAVALFAYYGRKLVGPWRATYVICAVLALWLNVFVGIVQSFGKFAYLHNLAPSGSEPPFAVAQGLGLILFVVAGFLAVRRYHPPLRT